MHLQREAVRVRGRARVLGLTRGVRGLVRILALFVRGLARGFALALGVYGLGLARGVALALLERALWLDSGLGTVLDLYGWSYWTKDGPWSSQCGREGSRGPEGPRELTRARVPAPIGCSGDEDRTGCGGRAWRLGLLFFGVRLAAWPSMTWRAELAGVSWF